MQKAQPLICEARIFTRLYSRFSTPEFATHLSRATIARYPSGTTLARFILGSILPPWPSSPCLSAGLRLQPPPGVLVLRGVEVLPFDIDEPSARTRTSSRASGISFSSASAARAADDA